MRCCGQLVAAQAEALRAVHDDEQELRPSPSLTVTRRRPGSSGEHRPLTPLDDSRLRRSPFGPASLFLVATLPASSLRWDDDQGRRATRATHTSHRHPSAGWDPVKHTAISRLLSSTRGPFEREVGWDDKAAKRGRHGCRPFTTGQGCPAVNPGPAGRPAQRARDWGVVFSCLLLFLTLHVRIVVASFDFLNQNGRRHRASG